MKRLILAICIYAALTGVLYVAFWIGNGFCDMSTWGIDRGLFAMFWAILSIIFIIVTGGVINDSIKD